MYETVTEDNTHILYKVNKRGEYSEIARVIDTGSSRLVIIDKYRFNSLKFRSEDCITFKLVGSSYYATIENELCIFKQPHYTELHREIMIANHNRYSLVCSKALKNVPEINNLLVDHDGILNNMLELIGKL